MLIANMLIANMVIADMGHRLYNQLLPHGNLA